MQGQRTECQDDGRRKGFCKHDAAWYCLRFVCWSCGRRGGEGQGLPVYQE